MLVPRVDLRKYTAIGGYSINPGIYRSVFHAVGVRYNSNSFFSSAYRPYIAPDGGFGIGRQSSFSGYASSSNFLGLPTSSTTSSRVGSFYFQKGLPSWNQELDVALNLTLYFSGTYTIPAYSVDTFFAGFEYANRAAALAATTGTNPGRQRERPWLADFSYITFQYYLIQDWFAKLPILCDSSNATTSGASSAYVIGFLPSRPLLEAPKLIEEERVNQLVSIGGARSYRVSYAKRRIYEVRMLLDGAQKQPRNDPLAMWGQFMRWTDAGVTLWIDRRWPCEFWRPANSMVCANMPNEITGTLLDASSLTFSPRDGIQDSYEVTIQIADESGLNPWLVGGMPS